MALPSNTQQRDTILKRVKEAVSYLKEMDVLKEDIKQLSAACAEEFEYPAKEFSALVKAEYDAAKVMDQIEKLQTSLAELEILKGE